MPELPGPEMRTPRGIDRDAVLQLDHRVAAAGGRAPGSAREDPAACGAAGLRPGRRGGPGTGRLWDFCGDLGPHRRCVRYEACSLPAFMQVRGLTAGLPR